MSCFLHGVQAVDRGSGVPELAKSEVCQLMALTVHNNHVIWNGKTCQHSCVTLDAGGGGLLSQP